MTKNDIEDLRGRSLTVKAALRLAFAAGAAYAIGSHKDFRQTHEDCEVVIRTIGECVVDRDGMEVG